MASASDEEQKIRAELQAVPEDDLAEQGVAGHLTNNCPALRKSEIEYYVGQN